VERTSSLSSFAAKDGAVVALYEWQPSGEPKAIVVLAHGLAEHAARYGDFASALTLRGYAVYGSDHRGHGATAGAIANLGDTGPDGWNATIHDLHDVVARAHAAYPSIPIFFFGHSMGSVLAQRFIETYGGELTGAILCGTFGNIEHLETVLQMADGAAAGAAASLPSELQPQMFAGFNIAFEPKTTGFEWLSRDEVEVQKYVDDPYCGFLLNNASMAAMLHGFADAWRAENEATVRPDLPILIIAGADDPAGGATGSVEALADRYRALGVRDVRVTLYPQDRHEILNELDREAVRTDVVAWLDAHLPA
jgi:alpha-beta hydrolase superfamily lysophospholipase